MSKEKKKLVIKFYELPVRIRDLTDEENEKIFGGKCKGVGYSCSRDDDCCGHLTCQPSSLTLLGLFFPACNQ